MFITTTPAVANYLNNINNDDNGAFGDVGWRRRAASLSDFLCSNSTVLLRASSYDHEDTMNDGDEDKALEPA